MGKQETNSKPGLIWLKTVGELSLLATKRGVPVMSSMGDVDEIDFLCARLKKCRQLEIDSMRKKPEVSQ